MTVMITELLEYTRTRLGRSIPISPEPSSMEEICGVVFDDIRAAYPERVFHLETSGDLEGTFDAARLHQVFTNLLENAAQHGANREPIRLAAHGESDRLTVQATNSDTYARLAAAIPRPAPRARPEPGEGHSGQIPAGAPTTGLPAQKEIPGQGF